MTIYFCVMINHGLEVPFRRAYILYSMLFLTAANPKIHLAFSPN